MSLRQPAVAGSFYPSEPSELRAQVEGYLGESNQDRTPKALVVPHAGYRYSAALAGEAYGLVAPMQGLLERVVVLGPNHTVPLRGVAAPSNMFWRTPLGDIEIDQPGIQRLVTQGLVVVDDLVHLREHGIEVQLPFLQVCFGREVTVLPLVVGEMPSEDVAELLQSCWGGAETLIVVSSDLSHFLDYDSAREIDEATAQYVLDAKPELLNLDSACGRYPLRGLLEVAGDLDMDIDLVGLCSSGDSSGDRNRVVGYGAFAFYETGA